MFVVLDCSACMLEKDLKPSRMFCVIKVKKFRKFKYKNLKLFKQKFKHFKLLEKFAFSFFDQNPISQLGLIITRNKTAEKHCDLVGNPRKFVDSLHKLKDKLCQGEPSLQNSLENSINVLKYID